MKSCKHRRFNWLKGVYESFRWDVSTEFNLKDLHARSFTERTPLLWGHSDVGNLHNLSGFSCRLTVLDVKTQPFHVITPHATQETEHSAASWWAASGLQRCNQPGWPPDSISIWLVTHKSPLWSALRRSAAKFSALDIKELHALLQISRYSILTISIT